MSKSERAYFILDVFTHEVLAGNPLAVVLDSDGLSDGEMQKIAREFNLSETVFVSPPKNPAHNAALRIFTPSCELPFAGHPTVGAAVLLGSQRFPDLERDMDSVMMLEEKIGLVRARVKLYANGAGGGAGDAVFDVPSLSKPFDIQLGSKDEIAAALGLHIKDIGFENHVPTVFAAGVPFVMVPIRDMEAIGRASPVLPSWNTAFGSHDHNDAYLYTRETVRHGSSFHTRMFAPTMGIVEDPATGSAAAAFAGCICRFDQPGKGTHSFVIEQGFEMGRASIINLEFEVADGRLSAERIGGKAVIVASGVLYI
ncbi:PhzF family phenazine biosynthesis protein [Cohaesibacter celericrescens]|uniref:Phenazine biosynthesis protein PhzF n=1 Tax=Cohaesibacter celericrescens TaxID=2067669 RepID=A0A2N5XM26_9HYPH|nr:PhzF family phenazine biosynthesis protein [Cohaesibacter celericrescens]PLW75477.1 phenazine biosynthesis protein PhzF [Cohaesibacter celericrescens]PLW78884.1 phenazine biosynthesis protein PhzF [Cohaesibacter celericrescens]